MIAIEYQRRGRISDRVIAAQVQNGFDSRDGGRQFKFHFDLIDPIGRGLIIF